MQIRVKFEDGHFVPLDKVKFNNGEIVKLNLIPRKEFSWRGALKGIKAKSVELQHRIMRLW